jgi:sortase A
VPDDPYAPEAVVEIGTVEIAKIGVRQRLMHGVTLRNIDIGPSHWPGSALPGEQGNMVVAGHRVTHGRPFRNLDQLAGGDEIVVTAQGTRATYRVASSFVVTPDRTDIANPTASPTLTLFACHPPGSARQRYVVRADLVTAQSV